MSSSNKALALTFAGTCVLGFIAYSAGCSVPSRTFYDDGGGTSNNGGNGNSAGSANGGTSNGGKGNSAGSANGGSGDTTAQGGEAGDSNLGVDRPNPTKGLIVIGGTEVDETKGVISVIAPDTGKELHREELPASTQIAAIGYDGADKRDIWFVFISPGTSFPAKPDKAVDLQVRYYADTVDRWVTLDEITPLQPPIPGTVTVLNNRLAYLSYVVVGSTPTPTLTILDTTDPTNVTTVTSNYMPATPFTGDLVSLVGTRGTAANAKSVGGTLDLGLSQSCSQGVCNFFIQPIPVGDTIGNAVGHEIGAYQGTPLSYAAKLQQLDYFALAPAAGNVQVYPAVAPDAPEAAIPFTAPQTATDLSDITVAECQNTAIFTAKSENALYGVTLGAGAGVKFDLGREGQLVAYEPFTHGVIATYNPPTDDFTTAAPDAGVPGPAIDAIDVTSTGGATLKIAARTAAWMPPTDLRANVLTTRFPVAFTCP